jgi:hypothetical protein
MPEPRSLQPTKLLIFVSTEVGTISARRLTSMAFSVRGEHRIDMRQEEGAEKWSTRQVRDVSKPDGAQKRKPYFADVAMVVWVVALIGIVVFAGAVIVLSLVSAAAPVGPRIAGASSDDAGAVVGPDGDGAVLAEDDWAYGPKLTR